MNYITKYNSPVGFLTIVSDSNYLIGLWMDNQKYYMHTIKGDILEDNSDPVIIKTIAWLNAYFNNEKPSPNDLPLRPDGSEFRKSVWEVLGEIPYGEVVTYGDIAKTIAKRKGIDNMSAQAVGGAVGHNPIGIIIPCHRVVGKDSSLTGYGGGMKRKIELLKHEGIDLSKYIIPTKGTAI